MSPDPRSLPDKPLLDLVCLLLLTGLLFAASIGERPYAVPSEARYVEIGREMAETGDLVTPRLNYVKYFEKPPLFYWVQAAATKVLGVNYLTARLPTAGFAVLLCLLTYCLGRTLYGRAAGWFGALMIATCLYLFALSRIVLLDVPVSVFITGTLAAFLYAATRPDGRVRTAALYFMYACAAGAVLTKGLIGIVLPGMVVFLWLALTRRWNLLMRVRLVSGIALLLALAAPWHVLVSLRNPEFPYFYFVHEHFIRYLTKEHGRYQPDWFFVPVLVVGLLPWLAFLPQAMNANLKGFWQRRREDGAPLFLVLWIGVIFIFFSLSDSKLVPYILPVFPPLFALLGAYFAQAWQDRKLPGYAAGVFVFIGLMMLMGALPSILDATLDSANKIRVALNGGKDAAQVFSIAGFVLAGLVLVIYIQGKRRHCLVAMLLAAAVTAQLGDQIAASYDKDTMKDAAAIIDTLGKNHEEVAAYDNYYQDLPVYLKRRVTVVNKLDELEFGTQHEDDSAWMIDDKEFWKRWNARDTLMFAVMREETYNRLIHSKLSDAARLHLYELHGFGRNMLFTNQQDPQHMKKKSPAT